jgi:hypothetical protein
MHVQRTDKRWSINTGNWKQTLLKDYDADQLPVNWGGTKTDPDGDPFCKSQVCSEIYWHIHFMIQLSKAQV